MTGEDERRIRGENRGREGKMIQGKRLQERRGEKERSKQVRRGKGERRKRGGGYKEKRRKERSNQVRRGHEERRRSEKEETKSRGGVVKSAQSVREKYHP